VPHRSFHSPVGNEPSLDRRRDVGKLNRCLAALPAQDFSLLAPHLRTVPLECGVTLHDVGDESEYVYFPNSGMVSSVAIMQSGATVETGTVGRAGIIGATAGLGSRRAFGKAVVQIAGDAVRLGASQFHVAAKESDVIRDLIVEYNDFLLSQTQQSVACNALHVLQSRLCRWLLQTQDCISSDVIPLTQEVLAQMLGVRRTTLTMVARLLQRAGMIRYRRGVIHIVSRAALEENACECYAVIKRHADNLFSNIAAT
jgi:CRP-like cAMP-binding protein